MTNIDVKVFRTRDGGWCARIEWDDKKTYTGEYPFPAGPLAEAADTIHKKLGLADPDDASWLERHT